MMIPSAYVQQLQEAYGAQPKSRSFVPLCEQLLKEGFSEEAFRVAHEGVTAFPGYVAGQVVLAKACHSTNRISQAMTILRLTLEAVPEQKAVWELLAQVYQQQGDYNGAAGIREEARTVGVVIGEPKNVSLEAAQSIDPLSPALLPVLELTEADVVTGGDVVACDDTDEDADSSQQTPFYTVTLAELYLAQGFPDKACTIYQELLKRDPQNHDLIARLAQLTGEPVKNPSEPVSKAGPLSPDEQEAVSILTSWLDNLTRGTSEQ